MARLGPLDPNAISGEQKEIYQAIAGRHPSGHVPLPMQLFLRSPQLADKAQQLGQFIRWGTEDLRLVELAICVTARYLNSDFEWAAHKPAAIENGMSEEIMDAIAQRKEPKFVKDDERLVYEFSKTLLETHKMPLDLYQRTLAATSERTIVEVIGALGFYLLIGFCLATFDVELGPNRKAELSPYN